MPVSFSDIEMAFEFVDGVKGVGDGGAFLCRQTGKIYYQSDSLFGEGLDDELPDDIDDSKKYIAIPQKRELGLGKPLAIDFARLFLPDDFDEVRDYFSGRGAYPKFKALLARRRAIDRWHAFENKATEQALRDWCEENSIEVVG